MTLHTVVKTKLAEKLGPNATQREIANRAGIGETEVSLALMCTGEADCPARHSARIQDAIAKAAGLSTSALFGGHAWFRLALSKLEERKKEAEAEVARREAEDDGRLAEPLAVEAEAIR